MCRKPFLFSCFCKTITPKSLMGPSGLPREKKNILANSDHFCFVNAVVSFLLSSCLDLCDLSGWPLAPWHMISVCELWPVWIIKEAWPQEDCIGNVSLWISVLVWGKRTEMRASVTFSECWICTHCRCVHCGFKETPEPLTWLKLTETNVFTVFPPYSRWLGTRDTREYVNMENQPRGRRMSVPDPYSSKLLKHVWCFY